MTRDEIRAVVLKALGDIAPEMNPEELKPDVGLREQLDLDSMDVLNFAVALHTALGVEIAEADYAKLVTLEGCVTYLVEALEKGR